MFQEPDNLSSNRRQAKCQDKLLDLVGFCLIRSGERSEPVARHPEVRAAQLGASKDAAEEVGAVALRGPHFARPPQGDGGSCSVPDKSTGMKNRVGGVSLRTQDNGAGEETCLQVSSTGRD